ncbi:MAG: hypothetical protein HY207_05935 [Nitrospirae bacterium]|nr:hypothetical protein [Nitrospirota bacterium]
MASQVVSRLAGRDAWWWTLLACLMILWLIVAVRAAVAPVHVSDALSTYAFKGKILFSERLLSASFFQTVEPANYPLAVPLQEVWIGWLVGAWDDWAIKVLFPSYLLALMFLVYGFLCKRWSARTAMWGTAFVAGLPLMFQHAQEGYTDLPLAYFVLAGSVLMSYYAMLRFPSWLVAGGLCAAGMVWTREDGAIVAVVNGILLLAVELREGGPQARSTWTALGLYAVLPTAVWSIWSLVKLHFGVSSNLMGYTGAVDLVSRVIDVAIAFVLALFLYGNWLILWTLFIVAVLWYSRLTLTRESVFLVWPVVGYLGIVAVLCVRTDLFQYVVGGSVLTRLILHVAPLAALGTVMVLGRAWGLAGAPPATGNAG